MAAEAPSKYGFYHHQSIVAFSAMIFCGVTGLVMFPIGLMMSLEIIVPIITFGSIAMLVSTFVFAYQADALTAKRDREWNTGWFQVTRYAWVSVHNERATDHVLKLAKPGVAGLNPVTLWMGEREVICRRPDQGLMDQLVAGEPVYGRLRYSDELESWEFEALPIPGM